MTMHSLRRSRLLPTVVVSAALLALAVAAMHEGARRIADLAQVRTTIDYGAGLLATHLPMTAVYGVVAATVAGAAFVIARASRPAAASGIPAAVLAGVLWPVLLIGLVQLGVLSGLRFLAARSGAAPAGAR